ncbi:MAG TPA: hypothetical protein VM618_04035, partial [Acidimicrobiia bacterium]|nr:hypothetical protein [Acidimicrobiia bacterium]
MSRARSILLTVALAGASLGGVVAAQAESPGIECTADPASYVTQSLTTGEAVAAAEPVLRFVNLSDSHIIDDEASPVMTANYLESVLDPTLNNQSGQRLQEEYTDEVLNAMIRTIDACGAESDLEFMIATGDLTDNQTLNETRRYIDNLDGVSGADTAYEAHCGYTTHDSRGVPKLGVGPCTEEMQDPFAVPTGKLVGDTQAPVPDPNDPTYQV